MPETLEAYETPYQTKGPNESFKKFIDKLKPALTLMRLYKVSSLPLRGDRLL
jgi:hypothetical protein